MNIYSRWVLTDKSNRELVVKFAGAFGDLDIEEGKTSMQGGDLYRRVMHHQERQDSPWVLPTNKDGQWVVGTADLDAGDQFGTRLVGILSPSAAVTEHACADLTDLLNNTRFGCEAVTFSLRALLSGVDTQEVQPTSVRLQTEAVRILVQSSDEDALRDIVTNLPGSAVGVTVKPTKAGGTSDVVTVTEDGSVIFTDTTDAEAVIDSMQQISASVSRAASVSAW